MKGWQVAADAALHLNDIDQALHYWSLAEKGLADTTDELVKGRLAAQSFRINLKAGNQTEAETSWKTAHDIFSRLGANYYLNQLETLANYS